MYPNPFTGNCSLQCISMSSVLLLKKQSPKNSKEESPLCSLIGRKVSIEDSFETTMGIYFVPVNNICSTNVLFLLLKTSKTFKQINRPDEVMEFLRSRKCRQIYFLKPHL